MSAVAPSSPLPSLSEDNNRERFSSDIGVSEDTLEAELFHNRHRKEGLTRLPRQGRTSLSRDPPTSSSSQPGLPSPSTSSFSSDISQDAKVTALPSIKELEFPRYYSSSPSDMSRGQEIETGSPYYYGSPEIFSMPSPRDNPFRPSSYRDLQGEPVYPTRPHHPHLQPTQVPVTSISPREIYKHPYPSESSRERVPTGTMFGRRGSSQRRDPQYVKRPRRRADEVERIYVCNWPECDKSYGALNHLNTHVRNAEHGPKREPKEFKQVRREQKAKLARMKLENSSAIYQIAGNAVYHTPQYTMPPATAPPFDYPQTLPRPPAMHPSSYDALPLREYESATVPANLLSHEGYPSRPSSSRDRQDAPPDRELASWPTSSSAQFRPSRWSPDNYKDLQSRYPEFAQGLLAQPHDTDISPRRFGPDNVRISTREMEGSWVDGGYDATGHSNYVQGPNGPNQTRDGHQHYPKRKEY